MKSIIWFGAALISVGTASAQKYNVINLGSFGGIGNSLANASNAAGQATGDADINPNDQQAFYYSGNGPIVNIGNFAGNPNGISQGTSINASGQIVGWGTATTGMEHAFSWTQSGGMHDMGLLSGGTGAVATWINDAGEAVGYGNTTGSAAEPFTWTQGGGMTNIGGFTGLTDQGSANGVNRNGQIVGGSTVVANQYSHAFRYTPGQGFVEIGDFDGGHQDSDGNAINDLGNIVGSATIGTAGGGRSDAAFFWSPSTGEVNIGGANPSAPNDTATGINNSNTVVGWGFTGAGDKGWVWTQSGGLQLMDSILDPATASNWDVVTCQSINDQGVISATAFHPGANGTAGFDAVLLVPEAVPEPSTTLVFGSLLGLAVLRRKTRRSGSRF